MVQSMFKPLQFRAVRYLNGGHTDAKRRFAVLQPKSPAMKSSIPLFALEAIDGLADDAAAQVDLLLKGAQGEQAMLRDESIRSIRPAVASMTRPQLDTLAQVAAKFPADADLVHRGMVQPP